MRVELRAVFTEDQLPESRLALYGTVPGAGNVSNASPASLPEDLDAERCMSLAAQTIVKADAAQYGKAYKRSRDAERIQPCPASVCGGAGAQSYAKRQRPLAWRMTDLVVCAEE